jgi:hypothetical protein
MCVCSLGGLGGDGRIYSDGVVDGMKDVVYRL